MRIKDVNEMSSDIFINNFKNVFEKTSSIALSTEKMRPFTNKNHLIETFINEFDKLTKESKQNIIRNHPDLGNRLKINNDLTEMSQNEQKNAGLDNCTEEEFMLFNQLNNEFKSKFNIPFIFAVKGQNKTLIIEEFERRLQNDNIEEELNESINQVKQIANFRLIEIVDE
jgi:2-oxo-4-hydroxy-4-carboxy-5-ureidoimidazoline decarboxylase